MIEINNLTPGKIDYSFLKDIAFKVLKAEGKDKIDLSIVIVCGERMKAINKKYRKTNKETDVLSFDYGDNTAEIVLCPSVIKKNAKIFDLGYNEELARVLIHGVLHIGGYDHEKSKEEEKIMEDKTEKYIK